MGKAIDVWAAAALLALVPAAGAAPIPESLGRPRVCLVLSGGGARGAAHIGVLKVLEEMRVPVDCIAGTSMGSLIGAGYATGMTIAEMEKLVASISTELLFKERPPRQEQAIRRKLDDATILFGPEIGLRDGELLLPKGFVSGIQLETVLRHLAKAKGFQRFDELAIPFRAVATDLVTGKPAVLDEGELANVMRASMSVPGVIAPAEIGSMILVDGGLTNNLPVDVARAMGADVVIAVNLGTPLMKREELGSLFGATVQMINILSEQNVQASLASLRPGDILVTPELGAFSAADFDHLPATIPTGEAAARKVVPQLERLRLSPEAYAALRARQLYAAVTTPPPIDEIRFTNLQRVNPAAALAVMDTRAGAPIDQAKLDADMRRLYGSGDFEHVNYRILEEPGRRVLAVEAIEKSWGPNYLRLGLGLSSDFRGDAFFNLLVSHRRSWLNALGAEWRNEFQVGRTTSVMSELYQPLDTRHSFFVAPRVWGERRPISLFRGNERLAQYDVRSANAALDIGSQFTRYGEARLGLLWGRIDARLDTGPAEFQPDPQRLRQGALTGRLIFDQLDSANFPRSGAFGSAHVHASREALGATTNHNRWDTEAMGVWSRGENTFNLAFKAGGRIGDEPLPVNENFQWGGFLQQSGYRTGALAGEKLTFARLMYYRKLMRQTLLEGVYAGFSLEAGRMERPLVAGSPAGLLKSASLFLGADTPIGPLYVGYGRAADGNSSLYLFLGRP
jgi:NTE family protein